MAQATPRASEPSTAATLSGDAVAQRNLDTTTPLKHQLADLYKLVDSIKICMMTTRRPDGHLVSRPMAVRKRIGTDMWCVVNRRVQCLWALVMCIAKCELKVTITTYRFITNNQSHKLEELRFDPHVNLSFYKEATGEWVSISGTAEVKQDRSLVDALWGPDMKAWFNDLGDGIHTGDPDDPRVTVAQVKAFSAYYYVQDRSKPAVLYELAKSTLTGEAPELGKVRLIDEEKVEVARKLESSA
ncbi:hypothetical protein SpCBS45565_g04155 [Spizellomyces sp. 'palustris']|nr:hypothetical protein SpCBS45565_g04155 [Spizellomyces sp. 'palustris']